MSNLDHKYREGVQHLNQNFAYFLTHVLNIGVPRQAGGLGTAAVAILHDMEDDDFAFLFDPAYAEKLTAEKMAFVLGHETMHILLNHLRLCKQDKFAWSPQCSEKVSCKTRFKADKKSKVCSACRKQKDKFNIAADCVINDYLVNMGMERVENLMYGEEVVGYNCANTTVSRVFDDVPDSMTDEGGQCNGNCQPGEGNPGEADGTCTCDFESIDNHDWMHESGEEEEKAADQAAEDNKQMPEDLERTKQDDSFKSDVNPGADMGGKQGFVENKNVGLKWAELLEKINPFVFKIGGPRPKATWHRLPRKTAGMANTRLPVYEHPHRNGVTGKKPAIVMMLDTSGSIGQEQANEFVNMARSIPQGKVKLFVATFTTQYQELDLENPSWNSGGTHFDCISSYIEDVVMPANNKEYPSAVVVVTDGAANFSSKRPKDKEAKGWWWLLTRDRDKDSNNAAFPGQRELLKKYVPSAVR